MKYNINSGTIILIFFCISFNFYSQTKINKSLNYWFDTSIGSKNLGINNGTLHINTLRSINDTHRYFGLDQYRIGNIIYDNQAYDDVNLKYDLLKDILIVKTDVQSNSLGINLIQEKTKAFTIDGKIFVNLNFQAIAQPQFVKGYYEVFPISNNLELYIKYHKDAIEILKNEGVFYRFEITTAFLIKSNDNYFKINDEKDLIALFPKHEDKINEYYLMSRDLKKSDGIQFMKNLMKYLNNFLVKTTN